MQPHSIVVVSLHSPKERLWGELVDISHAGVTMRAIDLGSFDDFVSQVLHPEGDRIGLPTLFFPMVRIERIALDEARGSVPSLAEMFERKVGRSLGEYLAQFACWSGAVRSRGKAERQMKNRILTVPNELTFLRLAFLPLFIIAIQYDRYAWALGILVAGGFSDALDGWLARQLNQKTALGAYLDPIADKLLMSSSYFVLALKGKIGWWLAILVLGRDVLLLIACAVILLTVGYRPFPPSIWGKLTTFFEIFLIVLVLVVAVSDRQVLTALREICGYCVAVLVVTSGLHYSIVVSRQLQAGQ